MSVNRWFRLDDPSAASESPLSSRTPTPPGTPPSLVAKIIDSDSPKVRPEPEVRFSIYASGRNCRLSESDQILTTHSFHRLGSWSMTAGPIPVLPGFPGFRYFQVQVTEKPPHSPQNADGIGLAIGLTMTCPRDAPLNSKTADEIPLSCLGGFDGRKWSALKGWQNWSSWRSDKLKVGDIVSVVVGLGVVSVWANGGCVGVIGGRGEWEGHINQPIYGVIDLLTAEGVSGVKLYHPNSDLFSNPSLFYDPQRKGQALEWSEIELLTLHEAETETVIGEEISRFPEIADLVGKNPPIIVFRDSKNFKMRTIFEIPRNFTDVLSDLEISSPCSDDPLIGRAERIRFSGFGRTLLAAGGNELFSLNLKLPGMLFTPLGWPSKVKVFRIGKGYKTEFSGESETEQSMQTVSTLYRVACADPASPDDSSNPSSEDEESKQVAGVVVGWVLRENSQGGCRLFIDLQFESEASSMKRWMLTKGLKNLVKSLKEWLNNK